MRASTPTKLSLWRFGQIMGINPYHFAGCIVDGVTSPTCDLAWRQYQWQNVDAISRETVAMAIAEAERQIERLVGFRLMPSWEVDERHEMHQPSKAELVFIDQSARRGFYRTVQTDWGHFISGGIKATDLIAADSAIAYSGTYSEVATVTAPLTAATADAAACEVRVFYPGKAGDPRWEIRPVTVDITAGTATITFNRAQCLLESIQEDLTGPDAPAELTVDGNFLTAVDVYRVWNDPQTQATLMWREVAGTLTVTSGEFEVMTGVLQSPNQRLGLVSVIPANWDAASEKFLTQQLAVNRGADVVRLWYFGGYEDKSAPGPCCQGVLAPYWETVVAHLAASKLNRNPCDCNPHLFEHFREDLSFEQGGEQFSRYRLNNWHAERVYESFGAVTRGAIEAYAAAVSAPGVRLGSQLSGGSVAVG